MKRRLLVARALLNNPKIIVADEPTTGLDPQARHLIWQRLRKLKSEGATLILTTQYMEEAQQLCDRIVIMHSGKILKAGLPARLIEDEIGREVAEVRVPPRTATRRSSPSSASSPAATSASAIRSISTAATATAFVRSSSNSTCRTRSTGRRPSRMFS